MSEPNNPANRLDELVSRFEKDARERPAITAEDGDEASPPPIEPTAAAHPTLSWAAEILAETRPSPGAVPAEREDLAAWWAGGRRVELDLAGGRRTIFRRVLGKEGPWMTLIHGFPTSSWDWEPVAGPLAAAGHRVMVLDLLGFGESDKPAGHDWSTFEQADIIEALWRQEGIEETQVVAHDVGLTVALELLARQGEARLPAHIPAMTLLNGGVYSGFHRPRRIQVLLQKPVIGSLIARMLNERAFGRALAEVFGPDHQPSPGDLHQHWLSVARRGGSRNYHRLIRYIPERRANAARWEGALERTTVPLRFAWGMADPVSGAHMAAVIRERRAGADMVELDGVGHYPHLEATEAIVAAILRGRPLD